MDYIIYFGLSIGILVFIHEFGHFAAAKLSGMRAEVFAIGFGSRLFGYNKKTGFSFGELPKDLELEGDTDYRLCLLPLGGYVKISGMIDESLDKKMLNSEPKPYEFRSKGFWKKAFVITAGVGMNLLLAYLIFWGSNYFKGKPVTETTTVGYVELNSLADSLGFKMNDEIVSINSEPVENWEQVRNEMYLSTIGEDLTIIVSRAGVNKTIAIDRSRIPDFETSGEFLSFAGRKPQVSTVSEDSPAQNAGILANDIIMEINNIDIGGTKQLMEIVSGNVGNELPVTVKRGEELITLNVTPGDDGKIGISIGDVYMGEVNFITRGFFESFYYAGADIVNITNLTFSVGKKVFTGDVELGKAFGGPVKIAQLAAKSADLGVETFLYFLAVLSLSLALINIVPFPVLDGGHLVVIIIETLARREIPVKIKLAVQQTGLVLLLILMAFIIYNDILSL